jgi:hypothetical protein
VLAFRKNDKLVAWRDKMHSHDSQYFWFGDKNDVMEVPSRYPNKPPTMKRDVVLDYTKLMGRVDGSDRLLPVYKNGKEVGKKNSSGFRKWVEWIDTVLVQEHYTKKPGRAKWNIPYSGLPDEELNVELHLIERKQKGSAACVMCKLSKLQKETVYYCKTCSKKPFLHPGNKCFELYHTVRRIWRNSRQLHL